MKKATPSAIGESVLFIALLSHELAHIIQATAVTAPS